MTEEIRACILCRGVKVKCMNNGDYNTPCARCSALNLPCAYSRKRRNLQREPPSARPASRAPVSIAPAPTLSGVSDSSPPYQQSSPRARSPAAADSRDPSLSIQHVSEIETSLFTPPLVMNPEQSTPIVVQGNSTWSQPSNRHRSASPAGLLFPSGSMPTSSARDYVAAAHTDVVRHLDPGEDRHCVPKAWQMSPQGKAQEPSDDPVSAGYITKEEANRLVNQFHEHLNAQISLLDSDLHTYEYLRGTCTLLFSAVLAASCKYFRKESYPLFLGRAQRLLSAAFEVGSCDIGILQAALILVYWKQPTDQSAWVKIGMAIRLGYQLGLHQVCTREGTVEEPVDRERLNGERTWFCLTAFDYTYAGLFSLPPTIRSYEIGDCENWARGHRHLKISDVDLGLACSLQHLPLIVSMSLRSLEGSDRALALMELEQRYHNSRALTQKWCGTPAREEDLIGGQKLAPLKMVMLSTTLSVRVQMLGYVHPHESGDILSECLELAVAIVEVLRDLQETLRFLQDVLSVKLAVFGTCMQSLYWRFSNPQRRLSISLLAQVYDICRTTSGDEQEMATAFVARFFEKLLRTLNTASKAFSRVPSPTAPEVGHEGEVTSSTEPATFPGLDMSLLNPIDDTVLHDLSLFLDNGITTGISTFSAFDEQYWTSLTTGLSLNLWGDNLGSQ